MESNGAFKGFEIGAKDYFDNVSKKFSDLRDSYRTGFQKATYEMNALELKEKVVQAFSNRGPKIEGIHEAYKKGFHEGVDVKTPRIKNLEDKAESISPPKNTLNKIAFNLGYNTKTILK